MIPKFGRFRSLLLAICSLPLCAAAAPGAVPARPNIVLILADDMGYADPACFGGVAVPTPHLDALARSGVRMTRFYAASAVCTPTRASILTGRFPLRLDIRAHFPDDESHLPRGATTLPRLLASAGYATAHLGKWHLGGLHVAHAGNRRAAIPGPREHGFESYLCQIEEPPLRGRMASERRLYRDGGTCLLRDDRVVPATDPYYSRHFTDILGTEAVRLVEEHARAGRPFFLNLWHLVPHTPYEPGSEPHFARTAAPGISDDQHRFRSMVAHLDATVGALLAKLEELRIRENTLVIFTSDNGGAWESDNGPLKGGKTDLHEGGIRVPFIASWPAGIPGGRVIDSPGGSVDLLPTLCAAAGVAIPGGAALDGIDLGGLWRGGAADLSRPPLLWQMDIYRAMQRHDSKPEPYATEAAIDGDWKLLTREGKPLELFNLRSDPGERTNLLTHESARAEELGRRIRVFLAEPRDRAGFPRPAPAK